MLNKPNMTAYFGAVGADSYAEQMKAQATKDGVNVQYMTTDQPTGTCAVLVTPDGERSLIANLAAANHFKAEHLETEGPKAVIAAAKIFYITVRSPPPPSPTVPRHCHRIPLFLF